ARRHASWSSRGGAWLGTPAPPRGGGAWRPPGGTSTRCPASPWRASGPCCSPSRPSARRPWRCICPITGREGRDRESGEARGASLLALRPIPSRGFSRPPPAVASLLLLMAPLAAAESDFGARVGLYTKHGQPYFGAEGVIPLKASFAINP